MNHKFPEFFQKATGFEPFPFQERLAQDIPSLVSIPTGCGKTAAVVLAWLWRRKLAVADENNDIGDSKDVPRRLVYCLPMRVLVRQTWENIIIWLHRLNLLSGKLELSESGKIEHYEPFGESANEDSTQRKVSVHLLMGGEVDKDWDRFPDRESILIGTQDMLLSRALNRGYAASRFRWPIQFALLNNDCLWVMDEVQLMGTGLSTTSQLQAFRRILGTSSPSRSLWMSATIRPDWINTVDVNLDEDASGELGLADEDRSFEELNQRLKAKKPLEPLLVTSENKKEKYEEIASMVLERHKPSSRTLVVLNTVDGAQKVFDSIEKTTKKENLNHSLVLIHSRYREPDRQKALESLLDEPTGDGIIAVTTQVVEAGVDVSATTLFTQLAPWASLVQRFGRCNRKGTQDDAGIFWFDEKMNKEGDSLPYTLEEIEKSRKILFSLSDGGPNALPDVEDDLALPHVIRLKDIIDLFDTSPDLAGADIDVTRFIREADERHVRVFFRNINDNERPSHDDPAPTRDELCPVPISDLRGKNRRDAWTWDHLENRWLRAENLVPGMTVMLRASEGGYNPSYGWTKNKKHIPSPLTSKQSLKPEGNDDDFYLKGNWQTIEEHTDAVFSELENLLGLCKVEEKSHLEALLKAARYHDAGKAHHVFQKALTGGTFSPPDNESNWAKCPGRASPYERKGFRHELASALALLTNGMPDLVAYLAAAHHGKIRLSIRSLPHEESPDNGELRFARGIRDGDEFGPVNVGSSVTLPETVIDLSYMEIGETENGASWVSRVLSLRDDPTLGPFRLAYLETLLRIADWRASDTPKKQERKETHEEEKNV